MAISMNSNPAPTRVIAQGQSTQGLRQPYSKQIKPEGPYSSFGKFTEDDRAKLVGHIANYHTSKTGTEEKIDAIELAFPLLVKGYKLLKQNDVLTQKQEASLKQIESLMVKMTGDLMYCCNSSDIALSSKSFSALKELPLKTAFKFSRICQVAKECRVPLIRLEAAQFLLDERTKTFSNPQDDKIIFNGRKIPLSNYIMYLIKDATENGTYSDVRGKFLETFFKTAETSGDTNYLEHLCSSKYPDTRQTARLFLEIVKRKDDVVRKAAITEAEKLTAGLFSGIERPKGYSLPNTGENIIDLQKMRLEQLNKRPTSEKVVRPPFEKRSYGTQAGSGL